MSKIPTMDEMAKQLAENALDNFLYDGKSLREWMKIIASEDAISRKAVLNILKDKWNMFSDANDAMQESIDTIEAISSVTPPKDDFLALCADESSSENPNKWNPCSEKMPKSGEYVGNVAKYYLVQNEYGDMMVAHYTHSEYWRQIHQLNPISDEIVAWCELPQPYKAESEDKNG